MMGFFASLRMTILLVSALLLPLSACGTKGSLKTPSQIAKEEQKKAREAEKEKAKMAREQAEEANPQQKTRGGVSPEPLPVTSPAAGEGN